jgi:hypothetical protein
VPQLRPAAWNFWGDWFSGAERNVPQAEVSKEASRLIRKEEGWFVLAGSSSDQESAQKLADSINKKQPSVYDASVSQLYNNKSTFQVVIGSDLTLDKAVSIKLRAMKDALSPDIVLWKKGG